MKEALFTLRLKHILHVGFSFSHRFGKRTLLSKAYWCEDAWAKRMESPLLREIKMDQYFVETDKKFNTKNLVSGVHIDLFANCIQDQSQLDELEHLLYRFRKTKRAREMMESTAYATVRAFLKFKDYESLYRILSHQQDYGVFPDFFSYNVLMDTFIEEKKFREAVQVAILMMLQEDFSNDISSFLAVYSCHLFLKNHSLDDLHPKPEVKTEATEEDDEEEVLVRVPFFRNPWHDDHFDLTEPRHLVGKTFFLAGREMKDDLLGRTFQLVGLGMYEKWERALEMLKSFSQSEGHLLLSEGVDDFKKYMDTIPSEDFKVQFEDLLEKMQGSGQVLSGELENRLNSNIESLPDYEKQDIETQLGLFKAWERDRQQALDREHMVLDKQRRLEAVARTKEYLYWKEKELFFFEKEDWILEEYKRAEEIAEKAREQKKGEDTYVLPEMVKQPRKEPSKYQKLAMIKKIGK